MDAELAAVKTDNERLRGLVESAQGGVEAANQEAAAARRDSAAALQQMEALSRDLQAAHSGLRTSHEAKLAAEREVQQIAARTGDSVAALSAARKEVTRLETEGRQLHQVIAQLRQARKTTRGDEESAVQERDELRVAHVALQNEVARLEKMVASVTANAEQVARLKGELSNALNKSVFLEQSLEEAKRQLATLENISYQRESQLDIARSDLLLARSDLDQRSQEVRNLVEALSQVQRDRDGEAAHAQLAVAERVEQARAEMAASAARKEQEWMDKFRVLDAQRQTAERLEEEQELRLRKAEMDFAAEKRRVQKTLEGALSQLSNSQHDVIDRQLIANLLVSYFKRRR